MGILRILCSKESDESKGTVRSLLQSINSEEFSELERNLRILGKSTPPLGNPIVETRKSMNECTHNPCAFLLQKEKASSEHVTTPQWGSQGRNRTLIENCYPTHMVSYC